MDTHTEHEDLKQLAPTLASIPKVDPFVVPQGLFERFPHRRIAAQAQQKAQARDKPPRPQPPGRFI